MGVVNIGEQVKRRARHKEKPLPADRRLFQGDDRRGVGQHLDLDGTMPLQALAIHELKLIGTTQKRYRRTVKLHAIAAHGERRGARQCDAGRYCTETRPWRSVTERQSGEAGHRPGLVRLPNDGRLCDRSVGRRP